MIELFGTISTVLAVSGVMLNNRLNRACFVVWMVSNAISAVLHVSTGIWSLVFRDVIFFALTIEGLYRWTVKKNLNNK